MGKEKIGGTSSPGPDEEKQHKHELAKKGEGTIILPDIEVDFKKSTTGKTKVTMAGYNNTLLKEKHGENPSRVNASAYPKSSIDKIDTNSSAIENIMDKSSVKKKYNEGGKKDTLSK